MDKHEYRLKTEQMLKHLENKSYKEALEIAESIDWKRVKNAAVLCTVSEIYEYNGDFEKSRDILFQAYDRSPDSRKIIYRLGTLALKLGDLKEAVDCYEEFIEVAPKDPNRHIFKYKILKSKNAPIEEQIAALEEFKKVEYVEKWAFELAQLYHEAGMLSECLEECDDLILWFSEGKYIYRAMELKMQYKPLTPLQHEKYMNRPGAVAEPKTEEVPVEVAVAAPEAEEAPVEVAVAEPQEVDPEVVEAVTTEPEAEVVAEVEAEEIIQVTEDVATEDTVAEPEVEKMATEETVVESNMEETAVKETPAEPEKPSLSIEEIVQDWQEQQKENAQIIQAERERIEMEKAQVEAAEVEEEKEELLPDDVRKLMEELEAESAEIEAQKSAGDEEAEEEVIEEEQKPLLQKVVEQLSALEFKAAEPVASEEPAAKEAIEEIELEEEEEGLKLGDTQQVALSAKALANAAKVDVPQEDDIEIPEVAVEPYVPEVPVTPSSEVAPLQETGAPYDTGFVVQGRYDLEAQSEIGLKAGLTEEQKKLFSYFVPVHGMSEQLVKVLQDDKNCKTRYGTSRIGNVLVVGRRGSGKTVLAVDIVKAIQKSRKMKHGKVAIVTADSLNKKNVSEIVDKLHGGALVIERASRLKRKTIEDLCEVMEGQTGELLVVMEDERKPIDRLLAEYPNFSKKFTSRIELPVFINDELVTFGQTYAKENGYKIDEMGILALYSDIDILQREEKVVTVADVKAIIDDAIENANRLTVKKLVKKVLGQNKDEADRVILKEEDFR